MIKTLLDWTSVAVAAGALMKLLPAIAALWTIAWLSISIWESKTMRGWCKRDKKPQVSAVETESVPLHVEGNDPPHGG